jgi:hypothetical protein
VHEVRSDDRYAPGGNQAGRRASLRDMRTRSRDVLTLSEQLDAMLLGWLEHHADRHRADQPTLRARALVSAAESHVDEVVAFCERWNMTVERAPADGGPWTILYVDGPALPVEGFSAITGMYRR